MGNRIFFIDKKGEEEFAFSFWRIGLFVVVAVTIAFSVIMFYSEGFDTRTFHAKSLEDKLFDCVIEKGFLKYPELLSEKDFDFVDKCGLNENIVDRNSDYFFEFVFNDNLGKKISSISTGKTELGLFCYGKKQGVDIKDSPFCTEKIRVANINDRNKENYKLNSNDIEIKLKLAILENGKNLPIN